METSEALAAVIPHSRVPDHVSCTFPHDSRSHDAVGVLLHVNLDESFRLTLQDRAVVILELGRLASERARVGTRDTGGRARHGRAGPVRLVDA